MPSRKNQADDSDVTSPAGIERMLRAHVERLYQATEGYPGGAGLRTLSGQLLTEPMLSFAVSSIGARLPAAAGASDSDKRDFPESEWYVAVTVCADLLPDVARTRMPGGYLALVSQLIAPAQTLPGGRNAAHWIYCCCDSERAGVHLTMLPNPNRPQTSPPLIAPDFLTAAERQQLNMSSVG
jgi:hypothetical protein